MPGTTDVGANIRELHQMKKHPSQSSRPAQAGHRSNAQIIAIAESQAREARSKGHPAKKSAHESHMHGGFHGK